MDSTNDLTITVCANYGWENLREYAISLVRSGFRGTKLLCTRNLSEKAAYYFTRLGFTIVDFPYVPGGFFISRYYPASEYIKARLHNLRYVIWTDCRDVVFQSDPSVWLERNLSPSRLLGCSLGLKIKDDGLENHWVSLCTPPEDFQWVREEDSLCVGTVAGDAQAMLAILSRIYEKGVALNKLRPDFQAGMDEGLFQYLMRSPEFKNIMRVSKPEEGFSAQCGYLLLPNFVRPWYMGSDGLVRLNGGSEPFSIVHQYDREANWRDLVCSRYADSSIQLPKFPPDQPYNPPLQGIAPRRLLRRKP